MNNTSDTTYLAIKSTLDAKVEMYKALERITHRQYLTAKSILSNPDFNNKSMNMLNTTLNHRGY